MAKIPAAVAAALQHCQTFHPEIELSAENETALAAKLLLSGADDLEYSVPPVLWKRALAAAVTIGLPDFVLHRLTPGMAALLFAEPPEADPLATLDGKLYTLALAHHCQVQPLESVDEQLEVFQQIPAPAALRLLQESLDEKDAGYPEILVIKKAYLTGDERKLGAELLGEFQRSPQSAALAEPLLYHRNQVMAARAAPYLRRGGAFIAVGAGHLVGPKGLVEVLRHQGFRVAPAP